MALASSKRDAMGSSSPGQLSSDDYGSAKGQDSGGVLIGDRRLRNDKSGAHIVAELCAGIQIIAASMADDRLAGLYGLSNSYEALGRG